MKNKQNKTKNRKCILKEEKKREVLIKWPLTVHKVK